MKPNYDHPTVKQINEGIAITQKRSKVEAPLWACPRCRRFVRRVEALSIFDSKIKICSYCAFQEKIAPDHNWIREVLVPLGEYDMQLKEQM